MMFLGFNGFGTTDAQSGDCMSVCLNVSGADNSVCSNACYQSSQSDCLSACNGLDSSSDAYSACGDACVSLPSGGGGGGGGGGSGSASASAGGTSWYQQLATGLATGVTRGIFTPGVPGTTAPPWYTTGTGIVLILALLGGGAYFLAKK